jgi:hypothetical protein
MIDIALAKETAVTLFSLSKITPSLPKNVGKCLETYKSGSNCGGS